MTAAGGVGGTRYIHEAAFYGSDEQLLAVVVPFLEEGLAAGEPVVVALEEREAALVQAALGDAPGVELVGGGGYTRPVATLVAYERRFDDLVAAGAEQIRVVGHVPHPGMGVPWEPWSRYEAAVNHAFAHLPVWGVCAYDTRVAPQQVLIDAVRTHPRLATCDGLHLDNGAFEDPAAFLRSCTPGVDPIEASPPALALADPTPSAARGAVADVARRAGLDGTALADLVVAVSEVTTNAFRHGRPPVSVRAWAGDGDVVVVVRDAGAGPADPFSGLLRPAPGRVGGYGLWLVHQLCDEVDLVADGDGFAVRLVAHAGPTPAPG